MKLDVEKDVERIQAIAKVVKHKFFTAFGCCDETFESYYDAISTIVDIEFSEEYTLKEQNSYIANACFNNLLAINKKRVGYWLKNRPSFVHDTSEICVSDVSKDETYSEYLKTIVSDVVDSLDGRFKEIVLDYLKTLNCSRTAENFGVSNQYAAKVVDYFRTKCFDLKRVRDEQEQRR